MYKKPTEAAKATEASGGIIGIGEFLLVSHLPEIETILEFFYIDCFTCLRWFNGWYTR